MRRDTRDQLAANFSLHLDTTVEPLRRDRMKASSATTVAVFGVYLMALSLGFLAAPQWVLAPAGIPVPQDVWIRVAGMLVGFIGFYYFRAARADLRVFFSWTVPVRLSVPVFFAVFVLLKLAP